MTDFIFVTTQFVGFHSYKDAPEEVAFLKDPHRHIFKVKVWIEVKHNNRDVEFFMFKKEVDAAIFVSFRYGDYGIDVGSCEMVCDDIYKYLIKKHEDREIWVEVSEDGENGAFKQYEKVNL